MNTHLRYWILALILIAFTGLELNAQRKYSNEFLSIGVGARSLAMGNSVVATTDNVTSAFWNPAGLSRLNSEWELGAMHSEYFAGMAKYDYGAAAYTYSDSLTFAVSGIRYGIDNIPNTLELVDANGNLRYDRISSFSAVDMAFLFSFAKISKIEGLSYGGNIKVIKRSTGDFASAWGFGLDFGLQYEVNNFMFGLTAKDITSTFNAWSFNTEELEDVFKVTGNEIPTNSMEYTMPKILLGAAYEQNLFSEFNATVELGIDAYTDGKRNALLKTNVASFDPHIGLELDYNKQIFLRAGINNIQEAREFGKKTTIMQPNIGLGVHFWKLSIDYALTNIGSSDLYSHVFTLRFFISEFEDYDDYEDDEMDNY